MAKVTTDKKADERTRQKQVLDAKRMLLDAEGRILDARAALDAAELDRKKAQEKLTALEKE